MKIGEYEVVIKKGEKELEAVPDDLPVFDFDGNQITMKEAQQGYMRTSDYTKKTQNVAEMRKFLTEDLGFQSEVQGIHTMRNLLDKLADLEEAGVFDSKTGEIKIPQSNAPSNQNIGSDGEEFTLEVQHLPIEVRNQLKQLENMQKDMGSLMGYLTRKEMRETYPSYTEEQIERCIKLAAIDPSRTPMEWAGVYQEEMKVGGQKAVDEYIDNLKKPKQEGHERPGSGEPAIEIFGENPVFSYDPQNHPDKTVLSPSEAAAKYLEAQAKLNEV